MLRRLNFIATTLTSTLALAACGGTDAPGMGVTGLGGNGSATGNAGNTSTVPTVVGTPTGANAGSSSTGTSSGTVTGVSTTTGTTGTATTTGAGAGPSQGGTTGMVTGTPNGGSNPITTGGSNPGSGGTSNGGSLTTGGGSAPVAGSGPDLDQLGKANAVPGEMTSVAQDYIRLGEIRILNNNWGSEDLGCNAPMSVFVNQDRTFGWSFNRGDCDTAMTNSKPDFPQIEFGIHPFGIGDSRVTSPEFSSTTLLPIQLKDVTSASVTVENLTATFQQESSWNITFEFWISERNPLEPNPGVYAELMTFWGWQSGRWPAEPNGMGPTGNGAGAQVQSGGKSYTLWVQDDQWADAQWRYFQFRADDGPQKSFNGTLDVKPFIDYLMNTRGYSGDFWISRLEVGSEIDDMTQGTVQMSNITFEVNNESRSAVIGN